MSKKTLNKANLETLGADRLADLLLEVSTGSADIKRRLRLELSHQLGAADLAQEVSKRLITLRKARGFVSWRKRKAFIKDLNTLVSMICEKIAPDNATLAFDLLWQFIDLAPAIYSRMDDSKGEMSELFRAALAHFQTVAPRALVDPEALADRVWTALQGNGHGEWDGIITFLASTLGDAGVARLRDNIAEYADQPIADDRADHEAIQFLRSLRGGSSYAADRKAQFVKACLQEIAAAMGDTGAYIAQFTDQDRRRKDIAAQVAALLMQHDQTAAALDALEYALEDTEPSSAWDDAYIVVLSAMGRENEAQEHRWTSFRETLNSQHLRDYLKALPDFEDVEAEDRARQLVLTFPRISTALSFCLKWPDLLTAATLIAHRKNEINGAHHFYLSPAAEALRDRHPLAAVTLWRAMIDDTLTNGHTQRYGHAAEYLSDCAAVEAQIVDNVTTLPHKDYLINLRLQHDRKASFWAKVR